MTSPKFDMYLEIVTSEHRNAYTVGKIAAAAYYAVEADNWWMPPPNRDFFVEYWKDDKPLLDIFESACDGEFVNYVGERVTQNRKARAGMDFLTKAYEHHRIREFRRGAKDLPEVRIQPDEGYQYDYNVAPPKKNKK